MRILYSMSFTKKYYVSGAAFIAAFLIFYTSCRKDTGPDLTGYEEGEEYQGGRNATVFDASLNAFGNSVPGLNGDQNSDFVVGNSFNRNPWVLAPSSTAARDGLGPFFNAVSCGSCHFKDGRGAPPEFGEPAVALLMKISIAGTDVHGGPKAVPNFGTQLNPSYIPGVTEGEGNVTITYTEIPGTYPDGTTYSLRQPTYTFQNGALSNVMSSPRVAPVMFGTGLIEAIPESVILGFADASDLDGDGISGKPNYVWNAVTQTMSLGRLGWKSGAPSIKQQVAAAFVNDIGITSTLFPEEALDGTQLTYNSLPNGGTPEITDNIFDKVIFYTAALAVPARRNVKDEDVLKGKLLFNEIGCNKCHIAKMETGASNYLPQLSQQTIFPYSDFLLHDMGSGLADNRPEFDADGREWRTTPLWGMGLTHTVNSHTYFLHDGRARGYEEAILWHGGEAETIKNKFMQLNSKQRNQIITFLKSF